MFSIVVLQLQLFHLPLYRLLELQRLLAQPRPVRLQQFIQRREQHVSEYIVVCSFFSFINEIG